MGHPERLLNEIADKLAVDYPAGAGHRYIFEKLIPGTAMAPDILIEHDGRYLCAVEIGYTRPEKISAYRNELRIPDVRWYDKQGVLHRNVTARIVKLKKGPQSEQRPDSSPFDPRLMTLKQVAAYVGLSMWTIRDYVLQGLIRTVRLPSLRTREGDKPKTTLHRVRIDKQDLDEWINSLRGGQND